MSGLSAGLSSKLFDRKETILRDCNKCAAAFHGLEINMVSTEHIFSKGLRKYAIILNHSQENHKPLNKCLFGYGNVHHLIHVNTG